MRNKNNETTRPIIRVELRHRQWVRISALIESTEVDHKARELVCTELLRLIDEAETAEFPRSEISIVIERM